MNSQANTVSENPRFCVADFAKLSDERRSRSKIYLLFIWIKELCVRKFEGLARSKLLGISQTEYFSTGHNLITLSDFYSACQNKCHVMKTSSA